MSEFANLNNLMFPGLPPGNNEHRFPTASKTIHNEIGENRGDKDVILYMFYLSQDGLPLAVQHPEIPLE